MARLLLPTVHSADVPTASAATLWLGRPFRFCISEPALELAGYQMYAVEKWIVERTRPITVLTVYTGDPAHKARSPLCSASPCADRRRQITVTALAPLPTLNAAQAKAERDAAVHHLRRDGARPKETPHGTLMVTSLAHFRSDYTIVHIPAGDFLAVQHKLYANINLLRTGCAGRTALTLEDPSDTTKERFRTTYLIPDPPAAHADRESLASSPSKSKAVAGRPRSGSLQQSRMQHSRSHSQPMLHTLGTLSPYPLPQPSATRAHANTGATDTQPALGPSQSIADAEPSLRLPLFNESVLELVKLLQAALAVCGLFPLRGVCEPRNMGSGSPEIRSTRGSTTTHTRTSITVPSSTAVDLSIVSFEPDGLLCDVTVEGLQRWVTEMGEVCAGVEPMERVVDPSAVAALLSFVLATRNKLASVGYSQLVPKDPFLDPHALLAALTAFANAHGHTSHQTAQAGSSSPSSAGASPASQISPNPIQPLQHPHHYHLSFSPHWHSPTASQTGSLQLAASSSAAPTLALAGPGAGSSTVVGSVATVPPPAHLTPSLYYLLASAHEHARRGKGVGMGKGKARAGVQGGAKGGTKGKGKGMHRVLLAKLDDLASEMRGEEGRWGKGEKEKERERDNEREKEKRDESGSSSDEGDTRTRKQSHSHTQSQARAGAQAQAEPRIRTRARAHSYLSPSSYQTFTRPTNAQDPLPGDGQPFAYDDTSIHSPVITHSHSHSHSHYYAFSHSPSRSRSPSHSPSPSPTRSLSLSRRPSHTRAHSHATSTSHTPSHARGIGTSGGQLLISGFGSIASGFGRATGSSSASGGAGSVVVPIADLAAFVRAVGVGRGGGKGKGAGIGMSMGMGMGGTGGEMDVGGIAPSVRVLWSGRVEALLWMRARARAREGVADLADREKERKRETKRDRDRDREKEKDRTKVTLRDRDRDRDKEKEKSPISDGDDTHPLSITAVDEKTDGGRSTEDEFPTSGAAWSGRVQKKIEAWAGLNRSKRSAEMNAPSGTFGGAGKAEGDRKTRSGSGAPVVVISHDAGDEDLLSSGQVSPISGTRIPGALTPFALSSAQTSSANLDLLSSPHVDASRSPSTGEEPSMSATEHGVRVGKSLSRWPPRKGKGGAVSWPVGGGEGEGEGRDAREDGMEDGRRRVRINVEGEEGEEGDMVDVVDGMSTEINRITRRRSFHDMKEYSYLRVLPLDMMRIDVELCGQLLIMRRREAHLENVVACLEVITASLASTNASLRSDHATHQPLLTALEAHTSRLKQIEAARDLARATALQVQALEYESNQFQVGDLWQMATPSRQKVLELREKVFGMGLTAGQGPSGRGKRRFGRVQWTLDGHERRVDVWGRTESEVEEERAAGFGIDGEDEDEESEEEGGAAEEEGPVEHHALKPIWLLRFFTSWAARWSSSGKKNRESGNGRAGSVSSVQGEETDAVVSGTVSPAAFDDDREPS